jgi:hypothetical protein
MKQRRTTGPSRQSASCCPSPLDGTSISRTPSTPNRSRAPAPRRYPRHPSWGRYTAARPAAASAPTPQARRNIEQSAPAAGAPGGRSIHGSPPGCASAGRPTGSRAATQYDLLADVRRLVHPRHLRYSLCRKYSFVVPSSSSCNAAGLPVIFMKLCCRDRL